MKESHQGETVAFARLKGIDDKPAFAWWTPHILWKRDVILSSIKSHVQKKQLTSMVLKSQQAWSMPWSWSDATRTQCGDMHW